MQLHAHESHAVLTRKHNKCACCIQCIRSFFVLMPILLCAAQAGGSAFVTTTLQRAGIRERLAAAIVEELALEGR